MKRDKLGIGLQVPRGILVRAAALARQIQSRAGVEVNRAEVLRRAIELGLPQLEDKWKRGGGR